MGGAKIILGGAKIILASGKIILGQKSVQHGSLNCLVKNLFHARSRMTSQMFRFSDDISRFIINIYYSMCVCLYHYALQIATYNDKDGIKGFIAYSYVSAWLK